ncbi:MAG: MFS transporter [Zoogloeaceae bacterium]|nr:MFS transporter [Zoogloeaceae bacterium]MCK6385291.1 MFS transporter [Rhodocyclaceae bacterium]
MKHLLRALGQRNFRIYFLGQSASFVGTWMQQIALAWLVYRLTGSPFMLGLVTFAGNIPILFLAPFGGVWSDRLNRRRAMLLTQALSLSQAAVLAGLTFAGLVEEWHLLAAAAFLGIVNALDTPLRQAFLLELVGSREDLPNAIALNSLMMNASRLVGPALAGLVLAAAGEAWCFLLNAASYLAMLAALAAMRLAAPARPRAAQDWLGGLAEAVRFARDCAPCRYLLGLVGLVSFVATPYASLMPVFARDLLGGDARTLGLLVGASGAGAIAGGLYLAGRHGVAGLERLIAGAAFSAGIGLLLFSQSGSLGLSLVLLPLVGFGIITVAASANTILQLIAPDAMRGRLVSLHIAAFLGMMPLGSLVFGLLAERFGAPTTVAAGGLFCLVGAAGFASRLGSMRSLLAPHYARRRD